ncbi:MAG: SPOR domain-containing protein [Acidobacteriota bacterium]
MLRSLVLVLLLVNAAFYAWTHGWLTSLTGVQPDAQHEPQRLAQQVHPDKLILVASGASVPTVATAPTSTSNANEPTVCLEAGPFDSAEGAQASEAVRAAQLPSGAWTSDTVAFPGEWLVYMGPYPDADMFARKLTELKRMRNVNIEEIQSPPALAHGLSLGRFNRQDEAVAALDSWRTRGVRTARVVAARPPMELQVIRVPRATTKIQVTLGGIKLPAGKAFTACRPQ